MIRFGAIATLFTLALLLGGCYHAAQQGETMEKKKEEAMMEEKKEKEAMMEKEEGN